MIRVLRQLFTRLRYLFAPRPPADLDEELEFHLAQSTDRNLAAGMSPAEARRQALIELGGIERTREQTYQQRPGWWLGTVSQDIRYALRGFRRNPVFTLAVLATLCVGIGATTAVFSVVDRILFRPLPYAKGDRLVSVGLTAPIIPQEFMLGGSYYEWRDNQKPFESLTSETGSRSCDLTERNPARLSCASVEQSFLPTFGVAPILGRNFQPEEDLPNRPKVALISYGLWLSHYALDPTIVNRLINIDGNQVRVIGVLPKDFEMPALEQADILVSEALDAAAQRKAEPGAVMYAFARLKPGITTTQAEAALQPLFNYSLNLAPPQFRNEVHLRVRSVRDRQIHDVRTASWILLGSGFAVMLIAFANVASLFMARSAQRARELAVRSALGASRLRIARQGLTEMLMLSFAGTAAGLILAEILLRTFIAIAPTGIPHLENAKLDIRIVLFAVALSLIGTLAFGLLPSMQSSRLASLSARSATSRAHAFLRRSLVVGQISICAVLLVAAALLVQSFGSLQRQNIGIETSGVLSAHIALPAYRYTNSQQQMEFFLKSESALRRLPGVSAVSISDSLPPGENHGRQIYSNIAIAGKPHPPAATGGMVTWRRVTPDYFKALNIPIVHGQPFSEDQRNASEQFLILSSLLAARLFGDGDPIGQHLQPVPNGTWYTVLGVAANVRNGGLTGIEEPEFYQLRRSLPDDWNRWGAFALKTSLPPQAIAPWVRAQIATVDPTVPVDIEAMRQTVSKLADRPRFETALLAFFAFCGLLMAVIGLYGVIAFVATQRTQEIGVRMALGATRLDILRLIAGEGIRLILLGGIIGLAAALASAQLLKGLLFNVPPRDPVTYTAVTLLLGVVALVATLIPARAAMKVEPVAALRYE